MWTHHQSLLVNLLRFAQIIDLNCFSYVFEYLRRISLGMLKTLGRYLAFDD